MSDDAENRTILVPQQVGVEKAEGPGMSECVRQFVRPAPIGSTNTIGAHSELSMSVNTYSWWTADLSKRLERAYISCFTSVIGVVFASLDEAS